MINSKRQTTWFVECNHCGNHAPMEIVTEYYFSTNTDYLEYQYYEPFPEEGYQYQLLLCLACKEVTLWKYYYHEQNPDDPEIEVLYPTPKSKLQGLPSKVRQAYEVAIKVRAIDANAYAVLLGRILEMICEDRKASGKDLYKKLSDLAAKGEIPAKLVGVADSLRLLRNVGAHASLGELTRDEVPILDDLCRAILEYVYSAPFLVEKAAQRINKLKEKRIKKAELDDKEERI